METFLVNFDKTLQPVTINQGFPELNKEPIPECYLVTESYWRAKRAE